MIFKNKPPNPNEAGRSHLKKGVSMDQKTQKLKLVIEKGTIVKIGSHPRELKEDVMVEVSEGFLNRQDVLEEGY